MPILGLLELHHLVQLLHFSDERIETLGGPKVLSWLVKETFRIHSLWSPVQCPLCHNYIVGVHGGCTVVIMLPL